MRSQVAHQQHQPQKHGWMRSTIMFLVDKHRSKLLRIMFAYGPFAVLNDYFIPFVGTLDDPYIPVWLVVLLFVFPKIRQYRSGRQPR